MHCSAPCKPHALSPCRRCSATAPCPLPGTLQPPWGPAHQESARCPPCGSQGRAGACRGAGSERASKHRWRVCRQVQMCSSHPAVGDAKKQEREATEGVECGGRTQVTGGGAAAPPNKHAPPQWLSQSATSAGRQWPASGLPLPYTRTACMRACMDAPLPNRSNEPRPAAQPLAIPSSNPTLLPHRGSSATPAAACRSRIFSSTMSASVFWW